MSLSDCSKCWNTPCTCGWNYRKYSVSDLTKIRDMFDSIIKWKSDHPDAKFGSYRFQTEDDNDFTEYMLKTNQLLR